MDARNPEFIHENRGLWLYRPPRWVFALGGFAVALVIFILVFDWNWMRGPIARYASHRLGRQVNIDGDLRIHLFSLHPNATINGLRVSNPDWAPKGDTADIPGLSVQVGLWRLLSGQVVWEQVIAQSPNISLLRDPQGRANWEFGKTAAENAKPFSLPPIRRFLISNGVIQIADERRHLTFSGTLSASETAGAKNSSGFSMTGQGLLNRHAFEMNVEGGPLINVDRDKPYPLKMEVRSDTTKVTAQATIRHPFDLGQIDGSVTFAGANLADLYYLTGIAFPRTSPYRLSATFAREGTTYHLTHMNGTVGNSDLEGWMVVDARTGRPYLTADMTSRRLDFVDLGPLLGGAPSRAKIAEAAVKAGISPDVAVDRTVVPQNRAYLLPDVPLAVDRVNQMDAKIHYSAQSIHSEDFPLRSFEMAMTIDHGVITVNPISFILSSGKIAGSATVDARKKTPKISADIQVRDIKLEQFVAKQGKDPSMLEGTVQARAVVNGEGASLHKAASTANGDFHFVVPGGAIRQRFADLMGISVDRAFLLSGKQQTNIRCVTGDFQVRGGVMSARSVVFDTDVMNVTGKGNINLKDETVSMELQGHPKKLTLLRLRAPIVVSGPLKSPNVGIKSGSIPAQAGIAAVLGVVATPFAALLPFIDPGLAKNADCVSLEQAASTTAAKVRK
jgi:hypothetical protein